MFMSILTGCWVHLLSPTFLLAMNGPRRVITRPRGSPKETLVSFTFSSLRTGREQHVPDSSNHSLHLLKLMNSNSPEGNCGERAARQHTHKYTTQHTTHHTTPHHKTRQDKTRQDKTRQDKTRQEKREEKRRERWGERRERHIQIHLQMCFFSEKTRHPRVRPHPDLPWKHITLSPSRQHQHNRITETSENWQSPSRDPLSNCPINSGRRQKVKLIILPASNRSCKFIHWP